VLALRETTCFGGPQCGEEAQRRQSLVQALIKPHEERWLSAAKNKEASTQTIIPRIKQLRIELVPRLAQLTKHDCEYREIWDTLDDIYIAQQIGLHPADYLDEPTDTRILETVERVYEDITDRNPVHSKLHCVIEVGEAIEVSAERLARGAVDPLTGEIHSNLTHMLRRLSREAAPL
jgi:hypothetical protein